MKYIITESSFKKIIDLYFDSEFQNCDIETRNYDEGYWTGLWSPNGTLLVGGPQDDSTDVWYFNGKYFDGQWKVFQIDPSEFGRHMRDFLNKKYKGVLKLSKVM